MKLKAIRDTFIVRELDDETKKSIIHVNFTDNTHLRGLVISTGEEVKNIKVGDVIIFTDAVKKLTDVLEYPVYIMTEDAVLARESN